MAGAGSRHDVLLPGSGRAARGVPPARGGGRRGPWARHDAGFTRTFDDTAAWLAVKTSKAAICQLLRIAWRTVGRISERVSTEAKAGRDLFASLTELGFE